MSDLEKINYLEIPTKDIAKVKEFFSSVFNWQFVDYGESYCAFSNAGINGGFFKSHQSAQSKSGSVLVVFYSTNLTRIREQIEKAGGEIVQDIFAFPGGHRFQFNDPTGNEFAVWSDCYHAE